MNRICRRAVDVVSRLLPAGEREAVCGDIAESGESGGDALRDILGVVLRKQAVLWTDWRPWLALVGFVWPVAAILSLSCAYLDRTYDLYLWIFRNHRDIDPQVLSQIGLVPRDGVARLVVGSSLLACWSWSYGFILRRLANRKVWIHGALLCVFVLALGTPLKRGYLYDVNGGVFPLTFYTVVFPLILQTVLVLVPFVSGMYQGADRGDSRPTVRAALWGAAIATPVAAQIWFYWFWWPQRISSPMQLLLLTAYWPVVYLVAAAFGRRRRLRT